MADTGEEAVFQVVKNRRNKGKKIIQRVEKGRQLDITNRASDDVDKESMVRRIDQCRSDISLSDFMANIEDILTQLRNHLKQMSQHQSAIHIESGSDSKDEGKGQRQEDSQNDPVLKTLVCYGIGNFTSCPIARHQLSLLLILRDKTKVQNVNCYVYDPVFTKSEKEILEKLNFNVLEINEEGKRVVDGPSLFFMPHCGRPLYNNLLWANWGREHLGQLMVIGNSLTDMAHRTPDRILENQTSYIYNILPYLREYPLKNTFRFNDIFNDTSLHVFRDQDLLKAEKEHWSERTQPVYDQTDLEIITNSR